MCLRCKTQHLMDVYGAIMAVKLISIFTVSGDIHSCLWAESLARWFPAYGELRGSCVPDLGALSFLSSLAPVPGCGVLENTKCSSVFTISQRHRKRAGRAALDLTHMCELQEDQESWDSQALPPPVTGWPQNGRTWNLELMFLLISEDNEISPAECEGET